MAHVKLVSPSGWGWDEPNVVPLRVLSGGGMGPNDRRDFVKRAGDASSVFLARLGEVKLAADDVPVHLISHGASEFWGPNRNGDGFREAVCIDHAGTFEKFARFYRNHRNKDPARSYGFPKLAAYNRSMHRVELLAILNATKEAAERNGGLVADEEIEKLARGEDIPVSMACRVPHDVCSWCKNKARTREEYCTEATCKAGGCRNNLTRLVKVAGDIHHLHVDNVDPCWFDISRVFRPADRTAYGGRADYLTKAASDGGFMGSDGAEGLGVVPPIGVILFQEGLPSGSWDQATLGRVKLAVALDSLERRHAPDRELARAFTPGVQPEVDLAALGADSPEKVAGAMAALAERGIVLPLRDFARMTKRAALARQAAGRLRGVLGRMIDDGTIEARMSRCPHAPAEKCAAAQREAAGLLYSSHSLDPEPVRRRCVLSAIRGHAAPGLESTFYAKSASAGAEALARDYATYKVAALERIAARDVDLPTAARMALVQNQVV